MLKSTRDQLAVDVAVESLHLAGQLNLRVQGTSMLPTVRPGTVATIQHMDPAGILPGEIALTRTSAGLRLHRVVRVLRAPDGLTFITRGDNHQHADPPVAASNVLGKLVTSSKPSLVTRLLRRMKAA
jgi:signal peptidase I